MVQSRNLELEELKSRANRLEMLLLDVDGVLTDGKIVLTGSDSETKQFDVKDGMGVTLAQKASIEVGIVTGRVSDVVRRRADELDIEKIYQGYFWKRDALEEIQETTELDPEQMAFMGDDVLDLAIMNAVGLSLSPADAHPSVRDQSDITFDSEGGHGAIREAVDYLLTLRNQRSEIYNHFSQGNYGT